MSKSEEFREEVYLSEGYQADALRNELSGHVTPSRMPGDPDPTLRDAFREAAAREPLIREPLRDQLREPLREPIHPQPIGRELGRDAMTDSFGRQPLHREPVGRVQGSPLPGSPLPTGSGAPPVQDLHKTATPPGRALSTAPAPAPQTQTAEDNSTMQRAMNILKQAAPFVARLLPLIDGNVTTAVSNLLSPRPHPQSVSVDLTPVHNQLSEMQVQQNDLRTSVQEQTTSIKRVEDQLELVREATDRNTLEQQEFIEDLKAVSHKVSLIAVGLSILLVLSVVVNLILYVYIRRVLP
jgi:hypothetical protein